MGLSTSPASSADDKLASPPVRGRLTAAENRVRRLAKLDRQYAPYAYVAPFFVVFAVFGLFPLLYTGWVSLHKVSLQNVNKSTWVGWDNYTFLLHDDQFWNAVKVTFCIGTMSAVPQLVAALGIAHVLNYKLRAQTFFRVMMLLPYATSVAASTIVFSQLFGSRRYGIINWFIGLFGVSPINWEAGTISSWVAISFIIMWRWTGYNALIYLAAMQAVPAELYDAASVDGANRWQQFWHVTVPSLRPTILFTVIVSTIGSLQIFAEPMLFGGGTTGPQGGAAHQYMTLGLLLYNEGWRTYKLGRAAATAWAMFVIIVVVVCINAFITTRAERRGHSAKKVKA